MKHETGEEFPAEELAVASWLRDVARETAARALPSASQLWWKAQIIRRLVERDALSERATRPLCLSQWLGLGLVCFVVALVITSLGSGLLGGLDLAAWTTGAAAWRFVLGLFLVGTVLPLLGLGTLWLLWREA